MSIYKVYKDFNNNIDESGVSPVRLFTSELRFRAGRYLIWILKRQIETKYHRLKLVCEPSTNNDFKIDNNKDLFYIEISVQDGNKKIDKKVKPEHKDFPINNEIFIYDVYYNPSAILDYRNLEKDEVEFDLKILGQQRKNDSEKEKIINGLTSQKVALKLLKEYPKPDLSFELSNNFCDVDGYEYQKSDHIELGVLKISNKSKKYFAYSLNCSVRLKTTNPELPDDLYSFGKEYEIEESAPTFSDEGGIMPKGQTILSSLKKDIATPIHLKLENLLPKNTVSVPVYVNLSKLPNPYDKNEYEIKISSEFTSEGIDKTISVAKKFVLKRDRQTTALMAFASENNKDFVPIEHTLNLEERVQWLNNEPKITRDILTIRLGNLAENYDDEDNRGKVQIRNLSFKFDSSDPLSQAKLKDGLKSPFKIDNFGGVKSLTFKDEKDAYQDFIIKLPFKNILDIPSDLYHVKCKVSFDFSVVEKNFFEVDFKHFEEDITFTIEKNPGPCWLALDFGTSAFVSGYYDGKSFNEYKFINLQKSFEELIRRRVGTASYNNENVDEHGTHFLSSTIKFELDKSLFGFEPNENLIRISPLNSEFQKERMVPYLKSLIGNEELPNPNNIYGDLSYLDEKGNSVTFSKAKIKTNDLIKSAYQQILDTFILPLIKNGGGGPDINKIIVTFPNNFSPKQLSIIRSIINDNFKDIFKPNYLTFISESDAVTSNYLGEWQTLNSKRGEKQKNAIKEKEYVLVYDMGAGTLDITYSVIITKNDNKKLVHLIGKTGNTLAGNYFDYVLADTISSIYVEKLINGLATFNVKDEDAALTSAKFKFKRFIKEKIKPVMYTDSSFEVDPNENEDWKIFVHDNSVKFKIDLTTIKDHKNVKEYLRRNSKEILANMFALFSPDENRIDTVIFSGRGTQLTALKDAVMETIKNDFKTNPYKIEIETERLKTVVVEGALRFASMYNNKFSTVKIVNRNLMTRYGILYKDGSNRDKFKELLNPQTKPTCGEPKYNNGLFISTYDTDEYCAEDTIDGRRISRPLTVDLSNSPTAWLIQTYSKDPAADYAHGKTEMITRILSINRSLLPQNALERVNVRLIITEDNKLKFSYGNLWRDETEPLFIDFEKDTLFQKSMWPFY